MKSFPCLSLLPNVLHTTLSRDPARPSVVGVGLIPRDLVFSPVSIQLKPINDRIAQAESIPRTLPSVRSPESQKCIAWFILFIGFADSDSRDWGAGGEASMGCTPASVLSVPIMMKSG